MALPGEYDTNRIYGRRKGHRLSPRKLRLIDELLPKLRLDLNEAPPRPLQSLFAVPVKQVWFEVGFGGGEHLAWQAETNPDRGFIGCEPYVNGVAKLLTEIEERALHNIRIWDGDAREVLDWLEDASLDRVFVLFPDPWPKTRHHKRRFISSDTLGRLARVMKPGAELRIASDIGDYVRSSLEALSASDGFEWTAECSADWLTRPDDWPQTRYEKKALGVGRTGYYLIFRRI